MKRIVILGAGISGLSTAFYLQRFNPEAEITLLESSSRVGGWIDTDHTSGFHFEKGPRTFLASRTKTLLELIQDLALQDQLITAGSSNRYFFIDDKLLKFPSNPLEFLTSKLTRGLLKALFSEWKKVPFLQDESVYDFAKRRFNKDVAKLIFDPIVVGIFGGDSRLISIKACFSQMKTFEEAHGSVLKGMWAKRRQKKETLLMPSTATYSLRGGAGAITEALGQALGSRIRFNAKVVALQQKDSLWQIVLENGEEVTGDRLISALPLQEMRSLFTPLAPNLINPLSEIPSQSLVILNLGYKQNVLPVQGFGYLTQYQAQKDVLGVVFDSSVFPEHNHRREETRLTVMLKEQGVSEGEYINRALKGLKESLKITTAPDVVSMKHAKHAIPQYYVGHLEKMKVFVQAFNAHFPNCYLVGNYLLGPSVGNCVERALSVARVCL